MVKTIGYWLYALFFHLFRICPVNGHKVFLVATHDCSPEGNIGIVVNQWKERDSAYRFVYMTRWDGIRHPWHFFITLSYHMATASYILEDNIFLPMAYLHFSKKTKIVQLWHGTGTIKKLGQSVNEGKLARLEYQANQRMTYLIVNSEYMKKIYQQAFAVDEEKIQVLGMPRTDLMLDVKYQEKSCKSFYQEYPKLKDKRLVLYAPTFRDQEVGHPSLHLDLKKMAECMPDDTALLLRLHPHVAESFARDDWDDYDGKIYNMSEYPQVSTLLFVAEQLITDYSSIVFEYCVLERPMLFYAYDLADFREDGRSFYENYEEYVPGPVCETEDELYQNLFEQYAKRREQAKAFKLTSYTWLDGGATKRLLDLLLL